MKKLIIAIIILFQVLEVSSQEIIKHMNSNLIVVADDLNFRENDDTNSKVIAKLNRGEILTLLEVVKSKDMVNNLFLGFEGKWLKVARMSTGKIGYVHGDYVRNQNAIYRKNQDCSKIQNGFWYGVYNDKGRLYMSFANPRIKKSLDGYSCITTDSSKFQYYICSSTKLDTGIIEGNIFNKKNEYLKINSKISLVRINQNQYDIVCAGTAQLKEGSLNRINEEIYFLRTEIDGGNRQYYEQNLSNVILKYGEVGYKVEFAADLNGDGVPELIISEGDNRSGSLYYFLSNSQGNLELQSITWTFSKC
jgi:hypothetical protein